MSAAYEAKEQRKHDKEQVRIATIKTTADERHAIKAAYGALWRERKQLANTPPDPELPERLHALAIKALTQDIDTLKSLINRMTSR